MFKATSSDVDAKGVSGVRNSNGDICKEFETLESDILLLSNPSHQLIEVRFHNYTRGGYDSDDR